MSALPELRESLESTMADMKGRGIVDQAKKEFPMLGNVPMKYKVSPRDNVGGLEYWNKEEVGTPESPRPKEFAIGEDGVEIYDVNIRPIDIMGDVASHNLIYNDPKMMQFYQQFTDSMTPDQQSRLKGQYRYAQEHHNEQRPFEQWSERSGMPGYFRGYPFQQWEKPEEMYTQEQMKQFDAMMQYLRGGK